MDSEFPHLRLWPVADSIEEITFVRKTADIWLYIIFAGPACEMGEGEKAHDHEIISASLSLP